MTAPRPHPRRKRSQTALALPPALIEEVGLLIGRSRRRLWTAAARRLDQAGQSMHDYVLLSRLAHEGPQAQRALALSTAQHPAAISRMLDDLERRRLVRRRRDPADRRHSIVTLTTRGRAVFQETRPHVLSAIGEALKPLSTRDRQQLSRLLGKLTAHAFTDPGADR